MKKMNKLSSSVRHLKIKKGDKVKVLLGKDRGKEGTVEFVVGKKNRVFVGGSNLYKRHVKKMNGVEGGIIDIPKSLNVSNVGLICPSCKKVTKIGYEIKKEVKSGASRRVRICRKCKKEIK